MRKTSALVSLFLMAVLWFAASPITVFAKDASNDTKLDTLLARLASAQTQAEGRAVEGEIWMHWFDQSPTPQIRKNLDQGRARREAHDFEAAETYFDAVVEAAPDYAEGYNQRAFARFLRENFTGALSDLERTLELEPRHFGALSGMYHVLRLQNRHKAAFSVLRSAVEIHPWIQERGALPEDMWPDAYRKIHQPGQRL